MSSSSALDLKRLTAEMPKGLRMPRTKVPTPNITPAAELMSTVPVTHRWRIIAGMKWSLWLSVLAIPFSYGTHFLLARVGPEVLGSYGVLCVYIGVVTGCLYFGGEAVPIRFLPQLAADQRLLFLAMYFFVIAAALLPWITVAFIWPHSLRLIFGEDGTDSFHLTMLTLAPVCIVFYLMTGALKGLLEMQAAHLLLRCVTVASFIIYGFLFCFDKNVLVSHHATIIPAIYICLSVLTSVAGICTLYRLSGGVNSNWRRFRFPEGFWRYTVATQAVGMIWFLIQRIDYIIVLNYGGVATLGRYVAVATMAMSIPLVNTFFTDALLPSLSTLVRSQMRAAAAEVFLVHMRIVFAVDTAVTCGLILLAEPVMGVFGPKYVSLRPVLVVMVSLVGVASPGLLGTIVLSSVGKQQRAVWVGVMQIGLYLVLFRWLWSGNGLLGAALACGIAMLLSNVTLMVVAHRSVPMSPVIFQSYVSYAMVVASAAAASGFLGPMRIGGALFFWLASIGVFCAIARYRRAEWGSLVRCLLPGRVERARDCCV